RRDARPRPRLVVRASCARRRRRRRALAAAGVRGPGDHHPHRAARGPALIRRLRRLRGPDPTPDRRPRGDPVSALITPTDLQDEIVTNPKLVVLDVQYTLTGEGPGLYAAGHVPGAPFVDLDAVLAGPAG